MSDSLAVVVLSGGLDSATALAVACESNHSAVQAITFEYGQKHSTEVAFATSLCEYYGVSQSIIPLPEALFKAGVLTTDEEVPDMRYDDLPSGTMSPTYVPFRNGNLLSMATAYADRELRATDRVVEEGNVVIHDPKFPGGAFLYAGMHSEDAAGFAYADCTPEFLGAMASAIYVGTYGRVRLNALFQHMTKVDIIILGMGLEVPYYLTHSCYRGTVPACGHCSTCHARLEAFEKAGFKDPIIYA